MAKLPEFARRLAGREDAGTTAPLTPQAEMERVRKSAKGLTYLVAALMAVTVIAAFAALYAAADSASTRARLEEDTVEVVVAAADIPRSTVITEGMLAYQKVPRAYLVSGAATDKSEVEGQQAAVAIGAGAQVTPAMATGAKSTASVARNLPAGHVAVTLTANAENGISGNIQPGDYVRIYRHVADDAAEAGYSARVAVEGIRVIALDTSIAQDSTAYSTVTLDATEDQAAKIIALRAEGDYDIALVAAADAGSGA